MSDCVYSSRSVRPKTVTSIKYSTETQINSVSICTGLSWEEVIKSLISQAHVCKMMPDSDNCLKNLLAANGFCKYAVSGTVGELADMLEKQSLPFEKCILKFGFSNGEYCAVFKEEGVVTVVGVRDNKNNIAKKTFDYCYGYYPGRDFRKSGKSKGHQWIEKSSAGKNRNLEYFNVNPGNYAIGDCTVRALCAAMETTWDEAVDMLARANRYTDPIINTEANINQALIDLNFERCPAIRKNGRFLTGKEFCDEMTYRYSGGERIFAYCGSSHVVAVLPFENENGSTVYKTQDTWDSTDRPIKDFWVIPPRRRRVKKAEESKTDNKLSFELKIGGECRHPVFGIGTVTAIDEKFVTAVFEKCGEKRMLKEWLLKQGNV